jgi:membrane associated rhomboid family serine protease
MIPLRDENPTRTFAGVTVLLIVANVIVFGYELTLASERQLQALLASYALVPAEVVSVPSLPAFGTVFTSMFLHGGLLHLAGNMLYLWIFGNNIEDAVGHGRFLVFYLLCGLAAAGTHIAMQPDSTVPTIGASGAVSGVLGAYLLLYPQAKVLVAVPIWVFLRLINVPAWLMLILWFGLQLLSGWLTAGNPQTTGIAFWAHIGGFVAGLILVPVFKKRRVRLFAR